MAARALLLVALLAATVDGRAFRRGQTGAASGSSSSEEEQDDAATRRPPTLDEDLATALRGCMDHYAADRGDRGVRTEAGAGAPDQCQQARQGTPLRRTASEAAPDRAWARRRGRRSRSNRSNLPGGGPDLSDSPPGGAVAAIRSWVTYYGELPGPSTSKGSKGVHWDASACAVHCAFVRTQLVSRSGLPDEALLSKRLEDSIEEPRRRLAAMRSAALCFARLGAVRDTDDDPCQYTTKLAKCMDMQVVKEYVRMKQSSS